MRFQPATPADAGPSRGPDLLLFLLQPDAAAAAQAALLQRALRGQFRDARGFAAPARLHVTLHTLGYHHGLPPALVQAALRAGGGVDAEPFGVCFDRLRAFHDAVQGRHGAALAGGGPGLQRLQRLLGEAMRAAALGPWVKAGFGPHVSLYYGSSSAVDVRVAPVAWTVREFCLVHSLQGAGRHVVLARWPLRQRQGELFPAGAMPAPPPRTRSRSAAPATGSR